MASYGLMRIGEWRKIKFVSFAVAISSILIAVFLYLPFLQKISLVNLKDAGEFLNSLKGQDIEIVTLPAERPVANLAVAVPILDLYTDKKICYDYLAIIPEDREEALVSPLRFTWEYKNPEYYKCGTGDEKLSALVVIANAPGKTSSRDIKEKMEGFAKTKIFDTSENIFEYKTFLTVYYK